MNNINQTPLGPEENYTYSDFRKLIKSIFSDLKKIFFWLFGLLVSFLNLFNIPLVIRYFVNVWHTHKQFLLKLAGFITLLYMCFLAYNGFVKYTYQSTEYKSSLNFIAQERNMSRTGQMTTTPIRAENFSDLAIKAEILNKALLNKISINDTIDYLANHYIKEYNLNDIWRHLEEKNDYTNYNLGEVRFKHDSMAIFSRSEKASLNLINKSIRIRNLTVDYDTSSFLCKISCLSSNGSLSNAILDEYYTEVKNNYIYNKGTLTNKALEVLEERSEEVLSDLSNTAKQMKVVNEMLQSEKKEYLPEIFKLESIDLDPDEFLSKEAMLYFNISSGKYKNVNTIYEEVIDKIDEIRFKLKNRVVKFQIIDNQVIPKKYEPNLMNNIIDKVFSPKLIYFFLKVLLFMFLITTVRTFFMERFS